MASNPHDSAAKASRDVVVSNRQGVHARPADMLVREAIKYRARVELVTDGQRYDGKSILALLTMAAACGARITIEADGDDSELAVNGIASLFERHFDEET